MAVAASILTAAYHLVREPAPYKELGPVYLRRLDHERAAARLTQRLRNLGYQVEIRQATA
jgi:transposase